MGIAAYRRLYTPPKWELEEGTPEQRELREKARALGLDLKGLKPLKGTLWAYSNDTLSLGSNKYPFYVSKQQEMLPEPFRALGYTMWETEERYTFYDDGETLRSLSESFPGHLFVLETLDEEGGRYVVYARDGQSEVVAVEMTFPSSTLCDTIDRTWKPSL